MLDEIILSIINITVASGFYAYAINKIGIVLQRL